MSKLKLDIGGIEEDFFSGSRLLGIISQLKNYRFCWMVNAQMNFDFKLNTDVEVQVIKKGRNYFFQVFYFYEPVSDVQHYIYQNQYEGEYLLPEFKHFDFLWMVKAGFIPEDSFIKLQQDLKKINGVQLVTELMQEKIKNKEKLNFVDKTSPKHQNNMKD